MLRKLSTLSLGLLTALSLPLLTGCSEGGRQVASDSPSISSSSVQQSPEPNPEPAGPKLIKLDRTVRRSIETPNDLVLHYDSFAVVTNEKAGEGVSYLVLHYQVSNEGKEPFSTMTERFAIVTDDDTKYSPDSQAVSAVQAERGLVDESESREMFNTRLQPGLKRHLFTAFILPTSALSKRLTLVALGDTMGELRMPLPIGNDLVASETPATTNSSQATDPSSTPDASTEENQSASEEPPKVQAVSAAASSLVEHFINLSNKNYEDAYNDFSTEWKPKQSYSDFVAGAEKNNWALCANPENCVVRDIPVDANHVDVDLDMSGFSSDQSIIRFSLVQTDGKWKISKGKRLPDGYKEP